MYLCSRFDTEYIGELISIGDDNREYGYHHNYIPFIFLNRTMTSCLQNAAKTCSLELWLYTQSPG